MFKKLAYAFKTKLKQCYVTDYQFLYIDHKIGVYFSSEFIDVGGLSTRYRDVMSFDLSSYKTTDTISKATLSLYWHHPAGETRTSDTIVEIYRPVAWNPSSVTWNSWTAAAGSWYDKNGIARGTPYATLTFPASTVLITSTMSLMLHSLCRNM
jgi:hypothetical protein